MKNLKFILSIIAVLFLSNSIQAQFIDKLAKKAEKKVEREAEKRTEKRVNKGIDNVFDGVEEGIDETVEGDPEKQKEAEKQKETEKKSTEKTNTQTKKEETNQAQNTEVVVKQEPTLTWNKYDFVPGSEIIFEDNQEGEQNGEFPSKWDLVSGSVENANFDGQNVIYFIKCNANSGGNIIPLLKNSKEDYLPEEFTVEFDAYFGAQSSSYYVNLSDIKNQVKLDNSMRADEKWIRFGKNGGEYEQDIERKFYPGFSGAKNDITSKWRHIALSFNTRALKVYMDDARIINIPNLGYNPTGITLGYHNPGGTTVGYIKNIRIAKGAVPLYDKFLTDGKFVTTGIKFDVAKATIKPESMGTINYIVKMMQDHPELKFSVEGHTDSDGSEAANQTLSEARAKAVMETLIKSGITADRLTSKGHGESKPMAGNDTPEGKAQNRRVEFVKI
jgi:OOP family OmpA-OmpF porin